MPHTAFRRKTRFSSWLGRELFEHPSYWYCSVYRVTTGPCSCEWGTAASRPSDPPPSPCRQVFFLVLQTCYYLLAGQVKCSKAWLKQLQQSVQDISQWADEGQWRQAHAVLKKSGGGVAPVANFANAPALFVSSDCLGQFTVAH